jgi:uncharacterized protein YodC (DUF2158 family)
MDENIQAGDLVRLKSGGPNMTVTQVGETAMLKVRSVWCVWFDHKMVQQSETFPIVSVEKVSQER